MWGGGFDCQQNLFQTFCLVALYTCAFIIGQYYSGNNISPKSGAAGTIFIFESESAMEFDP